MPDLAGQQSIPAVTFYVVVTGIIAIIGAGWGISSL